MNRREWLRFASAGCLATLPVQGRSSRAQEATYRSPYQLKYRHPESELAVGFDRPPWNSPLLESALPARDWYNPRQERKLGAWGPHARHYPAPAGLGHRSATWMQDRVILAASRWIGHPYQHHHIPDWNPPANWPWLKVAYGRNSAGIDCSNFSSFYYNYALGVKLDTGIRQQARRREVRGPGGRGVLTIKPIERAPYGELVKELQPADLLYIKNDQGRIAHVVLWLGVVGVSPNRVPLILDSTGAGHSDSNGNKIPIGIHIRPYSANSWYARDFAHAHRIIDGIPGVRAGEVPEAEEGGALDP
jgi:cell wall-associated NlpC family hydrolase